MNQVLLKLSPLRLNDSDTEEWPEEEIDENYAVTAAETEGRINSMVQVEGQESAGNEEIGDWEEDDEFNISDFQCKCSKNCLALFVKEDIENHILTVREMTKEEREMYIMGVLNEIGIDKHKTWRGDRKRKRYGYTFNGKKICRQSFQYIYDIGKCSLTNLITHMNLNGKVPRIHRNKGRAPHHALKYKEIKYCVEFIVNYSDQYGIPQPAAPRGRDGVAPVYLPASLSKEHLHKEYRLACVENNIRVLGITSFKETWTQCVPHIKIASPREDVCQKCEQIRKAISDSVTEEEKLRTTIDLQQHIQKAQKEREVYRQAIQDSKNELLDTRHEGPVPPCSSDLWKIHYTFDYSQQVSLPHHFRQMGPLFFLSLRKVQIFGVRLDGSAKQLNYLTDEDQSIGGFIINATFPVYLKENFNSDLDGDNQIQHFHLERYIIGYTLAVNSDRISDDIQPQIKTMINTRGYPFIHGQIHNTYGS